MQNFPGAVIERVTQIIEPVLEDMDIELVDVQFLQEHGRWVLRFFVDMEGGITLDDCARVSHEIEYMIEVEDLISHEYVLEVSSPGLNRPLKKEKDFLKALGRKVKVKTKEPVGGRRNFKGYLQGLKDGTLFIKTEMDVHSLALSSVEKANIIYEFEDKMN